MLVSFTRSRSDHTLVAHGCDEETINRLESWRARGTLLEMNRDFRRHCVTFSEHRSGNCVALTSVSL